jgi:demethylmenaquinone methyltransferase/2-methoxy-6-polyprenyl-1,4-benzoquinol methylase
VSLVSPLLDETGGRIVYSPQMKLSRRIRGHIRVPASKRLYVRSLFGRIARKYDITNDVMSLGLHRRWKERALELAEIEPGHLVLDLAAGTGDLALRAAPRTGTTGAVIAGDLTRPMMRVGRSREGGAGIRWVECDATALPFASGSLDRVVIGYGLRNFPNLGVCLGEIYRCLRPGGKLVTLDFGKPGSGRLTSLYLRYLDLSSRLVGWLLHRDVEAYAYIPESLRAYPAQAGVADLMRLLGFVWTGYIDIMLGTMALNFGQRPPEPAPTPALLSR